jgi:hypothetical protein
MFFENEEFLYLKINKNLAKCGIYDGIEKAVLLYI